MFAFCLGLGWCAGLHAAVRSAPQVPGLYTDLMPTILVKGVDLETLPDLVQPEYLLWDDLPIKVTEVGLPAGLRVAGRRVLGKPTRLDKMQIRCHAFCARLDKMQIRCHAFCARA